MKIQEILNENHGKPFALAWPKKNYKIYLRKIGWDYDTHTMYKTYSTTTDELRDYYENVFVPEGKSVYQNPAFDLFLAAHYDESVRRKLNKALRGYSTTILPTPQHEGFVISYDSVADATAKSHRGFLRGKKNIEAHTQASKQKHRKALDARRAAEKRIPTGVRNTTVLDPSSLKEIVKLGEPRPDLETYSGSPSGIQLSDVQERHYRELSEILARSNKRFDYIGYASFDAFPAYNRPQDKKVRLFRFVMTAPGFVWEKYEGDTQGGGRNTVYVGGKKMKLTSFLRLTPQQQDQLVQTS